MSVKLMFKKRPQALLRSANGLRSYRFYIREKGEPATAVVSDKDADYFRFEHGCEIVEAPIEEMFEEIEEEEEEEVEEAKPKKKKRKKK